MRAAATRATLALVVVMAAAALPGAPPAAAQGGTATNARAAIEAVRGQLRALAQDAGALRLELDRSPTARPTLSEDEATAIADGSERLAGWLDSRTIARTTARFDEDERRWTVSYISEGGTDDEKVEAVVLVGDRTAEIQELRTGPQVAWAMARGYPGAFGRAINREPIWLFLCALFLIPLLAPRRIVSWRTLDLLVLLSFSISLIWFNRGEIFTSVPLAYPPMLYLAARLGWIGLRRGKAGQDPEGRPPLAPAAPRPRFAGWAPTWVLATGLGVVLALRYGLNAFDSNVIDVGYAGVIGADRIAHGITPYGTFPSDCGSCDTYGPLSYLFYVPFEAVQPWLGEWDALPASHGAATAFDVLAVAGMFALGWSLAGPRLGAALGLAWAAFPFTGYALATNSNDSLVAAVLIWGLVAARHPVGRGLSVGLAVAAKFGPAILLPLWSRHPFPFPTRGTRGRLLAYGAGVGLAVGATGWVLLLDGDDGLVAFWSRTIGYQGGRDSPFSIWGQHPELRPLQLALMGIVALAALAMFRWPRRLDLLRMAALSGALIIGVQLTLTHWFYLYIPWFLPFALLAFVPEWTRPKEPAVPRESERPVPRESERAEPRAPALAP